jgi:hemoglobin-like flavoprotein
MTPRQIELVQASFDQVVPIADAVATIFYARLFDLDPAARALFPAEMGAQRRALMLTLGTIVRSLHRPDAIQPTIGALGQRHVGYGVDAAHYETVGIALVDAVEETLGPLFTPEIHDAWSAAYAFIAEAMRRDVPPRSPG